MTEPLDNGSRTASARPGGFRLNGAARTLADLGGWALRPAVELAELGRAAERRARREISRSAQRRALGLLDAVLASGFAGKALERSLAAALDSPALERSLVRALESPAVERSLVAALDSPAVERMVARVFESRVLDEAVARLLESEDLWILVDEVARSPAVADAIAQQGIGFADQVAGVVRGRSRTADERLEHVARRLLRRPPDGAGPAAPVKP